MRLLVGCIGALLLAAAIAGCQSMAAASPNFEQVMSEGETVYELNCQRCHHPQGQGYRHLFPNLAGSPMVTLYDPIPAIQIVQHGRGAMPSFNEALTDEEIAAVLTYIRNAWGNEASPVQSQQIQE